MRFPHPKGRESNPVPFEFPGPLRMSLADEVGTARMPPRPISSLRGSHALPPPVGRLVGFGSRAGFVVHAVRCRDCTPAERTVAKASGAGRGGPSTGAGGDPGIV